MTEGTQAREHRRLASSKLHPLLHPVPHVPISNLAAHHTCDHGGDRVLVDMQYTACLITGLVLTREVDLTASDRTGPKAGQYESHPAYLRCLPILIPAD